MTETVLLGLTFGVLLFARVPVVYCIGVAAAAAMLASMPFGPALTTTAQRMATGLDSFALMAVPLFILAGQLMNRGGIAVRLIDFAKALVGFLPGGLAIVNVVANMLFGSISGSAAAAASAVGGAMREELVKEGYPPTFCAAANLTSATTGLLIPPSNILIVYSLASGGVSIGALFLAGYVPGILTGSLIAAVAGFLAVRLRIPVARFPGVVTALRLFLRACPSLALLLVVIGGILAGAFTPTEAAGIAVLYAFLLCVVVYREIPWRQLPDVVLDAAKLSSIILLLIAASMAMSWMLALLEIPAQISAAVLAASDDPIVVLLLMNAILLVVGTFMDMTPAVLIFTPILLPVAVQLGIDPLHFGVILVLNLCVGLCTPPVGTLLFIGCSVAKTSIGQTLRPLLPFYAAMVAALLLVILFPELSLWLPRVLGSWAGG